MGCRVLKGSVLSLLNGFRVFSGVFRPNLQFGLEAGQAFSRRFVKKHGLKVDYFKIHATSGHVFIKRLHLTPLFLERKMKIEVLEER